MKLKTKLIPFVGVATVCAAVVPCVASCGKDTGNGMVSMLEKYVPTIRKMDYGYKNDFDANDSYLVALKQNPEVFYQDYYWSSSTLITDTQKKYESKHNDGGGEIEVVNPGKNPEVVTEEDIINEFVGGAKYHYIKVRDLQVESYQNPFADPKDTNHYIPVLSYTVDYDYCYDYSAIKQKVANKIQEEKITGSCTIKNMPFIIRYEPNTSLWRLGTTFPLLMTEKNGKKVFTNWSIGTTATIVDTLKSTSDIFANSTYTETTEVNLSFDADDKLDEKAEKGTDQLLLMTFQKMLISYTAAYSYYFFSIAYEGGEKEVQLWN